MKIGRQKGVARKVRLPQEIISFAETALSLEIPFQWKIHSIQNEVEFFDAPFPQRNEVLIHSQENWRDLLFVLL